jgi:hypothetical protein
VSQSGLSTVRTIFSYKSNASGISFGANFPRNAKNAQAMMQMNKIVLAELEHTANSWPAAGTRL